MEQGRDVQMNEFSRFSHIPPGWERQGCWKWKGQQGYRRATQAGTSGSQARKLIVGDPLSQGSQN